MKKVLCAVALLLLGSLAYADVQFQPSSKTVAVGDTFTLDVTISGVTGPNWLAGYQVYFTYDSSILQFNAGSSGIPSAYMTTDPSMWFANIVATPPVGFDVLSLESTTTLGGLQSGHDPFTLGVASFTALHAGTSALAFTGVVLADGNGDPISMALHDGSVTVTGGGAVPEPTAGLLFLIPAAFAAARLRKRRA